MSDRILKAKLALLRRRRPSRLQAAWLLWKGHGVVYRVALGSRDGWPTVHGERHHGPVLIAHCHIEGEQFKGTRFDHSEVGLYRA